MLRVNMGPSEHSLVDITMKSVVAGMTVFVVGSHYLLAKPSMTVVLVGRVIGRQLMMRLS
jgi:hypothetical protein